MTSSPNRRYSILIIEDNPLDAMLAQQRLRAAGFEFDCVIADCRAQFDSALASHQFDLVLADYSLPDFDGVTALDIIRAIYPRLPFIFISGVLGEDIAVETLLRGATDYVLKQKIDRLVPAVKRALAEYEDYRSREKAEQDLKKVEARFQKLTNNLPAMVWTCNNDGRLTFANSQWQSCIGETESWLQPDIVHPSDFKDGKQAWEYARQHGEDLVIDCRFKCLPEGAYRWHIVRATPLITEAPNTEDISIEWVGTCTDIEQQKIRDEELKTAERLALTGRMASVIAHEINNPLEALTNILYLVQSEQNSPEEARAFLMDAQHELLRISAITKQTLAWARQEGGIVETPVDQLMEDTLKLFSGKIRNKAIRLSTNLSRNHVVRVVPGEICQVLANVMSNAIDAVPVNGTIDVVIEGSDDGSTVRISVKDNGNGMEPKQMENLFQPFQSTKGNLGNGLGLYVSKGIIDRHDGELIIESEPGIGTMVSVILRTVLAAKDDVSQIPETLSQRIAS